MAKTMSERPRRAATLKSVPQSLTNIEAKNARPDEPDAEQPSWDEKLNDKEHFKKSKSKLAHKKGSKSVYLPAPFLSMPFDVLFEIGEHLTPGDLLHLSLTCKILRVVLLGTSAKSLWTNARKRLNFPDLSPLAPMTEQQYAYFVWRMHECQMCGTKDNSVMIDYANKRRLCGACSGHV
ncbi:F-box domain contaning protein [Pseudohyphozyma bogoriensis]|nr:F-box domain contaning protein [Pseudohyphozyma bogoriensis]